MRSRLDRSRSSRQIRTALLRLDRRRRIGAGSGRTSCSIHLRSRTTNQSTARTPAGGTLARAARPSCAKVGAGVAAPASPASPAARVAASRARSARVAAPEGSRARVAVRCSSAANREAVVGVEGRVYPSRPPARAEFTALRVHRAQHIPLPCLRAFTRFYRDRPSQTFCLPPSLALFDRLSALTPSSWGGASPLSTTLRLFCNDRSCRRPSAVSPLRIAYSH